jgi:protein-S-isoprenylcysteine O-methyltransferase Ste14
MSALELKIPPVLITSLFALVMWLVSRLTPAIPISPALKIIFLLVFASLGAYVGLAAVAAFRKANTTVNPLTPESISSLVVSGIFRRTRNPMYLALLLALTGWGLYLANLLSLLLTIGFIFYMNRFQIQPEERALEEIFGSEFNDYKKQVRRWI